ncbi:MAG TPA: histidine kinase [Clostridiales bacterium UBA8960]|nr:histidine kinase [Clostridiales bacterium UBA8960]
MWRMKNVRVAALMIIILVSSTLNAFSVEGELQLTEDERAFIKENPVIKLAVDPTFFPYEFIDTDGTYSGIAADYLELISQKTSLEFVVPSNLTWSQAYEKTVLGELDMLSCVLKTTSRELYFNYTAPYYYTYRSIFVSAFNREVSQLSDLYGKTVAVQRNSSHHSFLNDYPNITLSLYETVDEALQAVAEAKELAFIGNFATTNFIIKQIGITNLRSLSIDRDTRQGLHFAVRKDWPELVTILNKAIASITEAEKIAINNKWLGIETQVDYSRVIRIALMVGSVVFVIIFITLFWTIRLKKEVERRKIIEADLKVAKREAEVANQIKSTFLARMSHEIRTPLNAITGMSYILKKTELTATQQQYLDKISRASKDMLSIINDILDFSKIESGKISIEHISFKLDDVLEQLLNIVSFKIEEQEIDFTLNKDSTIPTFLKGDPIRLEQVLLNLVNNALKFTKEGEVSLSIRQIAKVKSTCFLEFTIKDSGIGMSQDQLDSLFVPFTQADSSINRRFGGTGLGLSIVKHLVEMMNGTVSVFSELGEGSTFVVQMEFEEDYNKDYEEKKAEASVYFENIRVLVVEKSLFHTNLLKEYLNAFNIVAEFVKTGNRAIEMIESAAVDGSHPYNLLIVDYETPKQNGIKLCQAIQNIASIREKPKCLLMFPITKLELYDEVESDLYTLGITKPIIPSVLFNAIVELFKINIMAKHTKITDQIKSKPIVKQPLKILVVEDNKTNQFIAKSLLEQISDQVILTDNGLEGVNYFIAHVDEIDLILMDLHMPVMDGYEATKKIRNISNKVPIIAMTADAIAGVKEKCIEVGFTRFVSKPFDPDTFIKDILEESKLLDKALDPDAKVEVATILNKNLGIRAFSGNEKLYYQVLAVYLTENSDTVEQVKTLVSNGDYNAAAKLIHKIKSSTGTIGAKALFDFCIDFQFALENKDQAEILEMTAVFDEKLTQLLKEITLNQL